MRVGRCELDGDVRWVLKRTTSKQWSPVRVTSMTHSFRTDCGVSNSNWKVSFLKVHSLQNPKQLRNKDRMNLLDFDFDAWMKQKPFKRLIGREKRKYMKNYFSDNF